MPLFTCPVCQCSLKIPDNLAGHKVKCTMCQHIFVAGAAMPPAALPPVRPGNVPPERKASSGAISSASKPPKQGSNRGSSPKRVKRHVEEDTFDEPERRGSPVVLLASLGGGLLLVGVAVIWFVFLRPGGDSIPPVGNGGTNGGGGGNPNVKIDNIPKLELPPEQKFLPDQAESIFSVRVADLLACEACQKLRKDIPKLEEALKEAEKIKSEMGIDLADLTSLIITDNGDRPVDVALIRTKKEYTPDTIVMNLKQPAQATPIQFGIHTIHQIGNGKAFCFVESKLILMGPPETLQQILQRNGAPNLTPEFKEVIGQINFATTMVGAMTGNALNKPMTNSLLVAGILQPVPRYALVEVTLEAIVQIKITAAFADEQARQDAGDRFKGALATFELNKDIPPPVKSLINTLHLSAAGPRMTIQANANPEVIVELAREASSGKIAALPPKVVALLGGNPIGPGPVKEPPAQPAKTEMVKMNGPFTDIRVFNPGDKITYEFPVLALQPVDFAIKARGGRTTDLQIKVLHNGALVAQDGGQKSEYPLKWIPAQASSFVVEVVCADKVPSNCVIDFKQTAPAPAPMSGTPGAIQKTGPFAEHVTLLAKNSVLYEFPVQEGKTATFSIKPQFDASLSVQLVHNGIPVVQNSGLKPNFILTWNPVAKGNAVVQVISTDDMNNLCTVSFGQGGPPPAPPPLPPIEGAVQKPGAFKEVLAIKPKDVYLYEFPVEVGKAAGLQIKPQIDAALDIKIVQNGKVVAVDGGLKNNFFLTWYPVAAGKASVRIYSGDNLDNNCTVAFSQGNFVPPGLAGPTIIKFGPFTANGTIKPNDQFNYKIPVKAGVPATFTITAEFDAKLNIQVKQKGQLVAYDLGRGIKKSFVLNWTPESDGDTYVQVLSTDELTNNCSVSFTQQGGSGVPKTPLPSTNGKK